MLSVFMPALTVLVCILLMIRKTLLTVALSFAACSGGDGGSGVDGSKDLAALSVTETAQICEYAESFYNPIKFHEINCAVDSLVSTLDFMACKAAYDTCIAGGVEPVDLKCEDVLDELPRCAGRVTVSEVESCEADRADLVNSFLLSCGSTSIELEGLGAKPASCALIEGKCFELDIPFY